MKIAYVLNTYPEGSHTFIRREIEALERCGHEVLRFAMRRPAGTVADPADLKEQDKTVYVLANGAGELFRSCVTETASNPGGFWQGARLAMGGALRHAVYLAEACFLARRLRTENVRHIHAHFGTNAATVAMLVSALTGIPYSFTVHGPEEFDRPEALDLPQKMRRAAFTVAVSQFGRSQLCRWAAPERWDRIKVVHCGVDPGEFGNPPELPREKRVVSVGRFAEQKGQLVLIEAMAQLRQTDPGVSLTLVGDGPMRAEIETLIQRHRLEDRVTLTGWLDGSGVRREMARAQALVMPSFAEGLPVAIMEAMALQRPVIATYVAGIPELVRPGENGWLVPAGDALALAEAIRTLAATPRDRLQAMGCAARVRALERHDIDVEAGRLAGHFEASLSIVPEPTWASRAAPVAASSGSPAHKP